MKLIASLAGLTAALGAYLNLSCVGTTKWVGLAVLLTGVAAFVLCICVSRKQKKTVYELHEQLIAFLEGRDKTPKFSTDDNTFALLENDVVELENRLLLEHNNRQKEIQKNAEFIADISHQLKTPLAALRLYCEMDNGYDSGAHTPQQLLLIERMEHLIYSLLRLEKLRANIYEMNFTAQNLSELVKRVWEELQPLYSENAFYVTGKAAMRCDPYWMGEALKNILINSCRHTPPKGWIQVSLAAADTSITVTVKDNGKGIPEEELPKLFHRFYRSSHTQKGGAGIGLAITRTIVERHHGTIYAENTANGLKITLCFPRLDGVLAIG
ncbi:MAG: HAMP domain-containing sensor histidine kinase [Syntrophaceticus sp.]|jgi:signal transduction histidine kinase|nr:HAMP domain-containing sensor histidine kinase [Syntrophaceticus sp.]MDD4359966.1 HAMP domain-containing sensor histidine kinase [Syntrophaceticus sp.]MDD4782509.1 HAMP domain-containing sensor histidine kinase [Syntrophaceticus sp.]